MGGNQDYIDFTRQLENGGIWMNDFSDEQTAVKSIKFNNICPKI